MTITIKKYYTLWFAGICVAVFILQNFFSGFTDMFMLTGDAFSKPWQFLTAVFLHGGLAHLLYNLLALVVFGLILEGLIGSKKFLWFFLISGVVANGISFFWYPNALGASGAIMAVMGCLAVLRPMMTIWLYSLPMPMFIGAIIWIGGNVLGIFGFGDQGVGYLAHLSGLVIGLAYGIFLRIKYPSPKVYKSRISIDENSVRNWEDENFGR